MRDTCIHHRSAYLALGPCSTSNSSFLLMSTVRGAPEVGSLLPMWILEWSSWLKLVPALAVARDLMSCCLSNKQKQKVNYVPAPHSLAIFLLPGVSDATCCLAGFSELCIAHLPDCLPAIPPWHLPVTSWSCPNLVEQSLNLGVLAFSWLINRTCCYRILVLTLNPVHLSPMKERYWWKKWGWECLEIGMINQLTCHREAIT